MEVWSVITNITVLLTVALVLGVVAQRLKQSAVVGYLLAGLLLGPSALGVIDDPASIRTFAELGVVLLIFSIGLELPVARIRAIGSAALIAGTLQIAVTAAVFAFGGKLLGLSWTTAWALGLVAAPSSTACVIRLLEQRTELDSLHGRMALGVLLLQDAALMPLILAMSLLGSGAGESTGWALVSSFIRMAGLMGVLYLAVRYLLPRALDRTTVLRNRELPLLLAIAVVLSSAGAAHALHISPVLGAFAAGILLAESPYALWIRADVGSLRTVFLTLFFASLAMLDDVSWVRANYLWLLLTVPLVLALKTAVVYVVTRVSRLPVRARVAAGLCLAQTGEFSFVLAQVGRENGALTSDWNQLIIATTVLGLLVTPYLLRVAARIAQAGSATTALAGDGAHHYRDHVVVIGLGPAGQTVCRSLAGQTEMALIDMNPDFRQHAQDVAAEFIAGDATQEPVLAHAGVERARAVVVTIPDHAMALRVIQLISAIAPETAIFTRARTQRFAALLETASTEVVDDEHAAGERLADRVNRALGFQESRAT